MRVRKKEKGACHQFQTVIELSRPFGFRGKSGLEDGLVAIDLDQRAFSNVGAKNFGAAV